jgi:biopolymer transport protein ExbB/TolQ
MLERLQNLSIPIENLVKNITATQASDLVIFTIIFILCFGIILKLFGVLPKFVSYVPTLLTSLGIFGTFIGITLGLLSFDHKSIDTSIDQLLAGMKTAFITSLVGMAGAIIFKIIDTTIPSSRLTNYLYYKLFRKKITQSIETTPKDILLTLQEQNHYLKELGKISLLLSDNKVLDQIKIMHTDLVQNSERQVKFLANINKSQMDQLQNFNSFSTDLRQQLNDFAELLSKSATEQVINALKEVIVDFNKHLTEQFGDNFKQLNEAVHRLLIWQEQYKQQLTEMQVQYSQGVLAITQTEKSLENISQESKIIPITMKNLKEILVVNQYQITELNSYLDAFKDIRDKAVEAIPEIRQQIDNTVKAVQESVNIASTHYTKLLDESDKYIKQHQETNTNLLDQFLNASQQNVQVIVEGSQKISKELKGSANEMSRIIVDGANEFQNTVHNTNTSLINTSNYLQNQTEVIKNTLQNTVDDLNKYFRDMLNNLISESQIMNTTFIKANQELAIDTQKIRNNLVSTIEETLQSLKNQTHQQLSSIYQAQNKEIERTFRALEEEIKKRVSLSSETVNETLKVIDKSMQQEIQRVMSEMGRALTAISGKFADDYTRMLALINPNKRL